MEIKVIKQIMAWNEDVSAQVQAKLAADKVLLLNIMGSPGAGKTSFILQLIANLRAEYKIGVIEGDITGIVDAEIIDNLGIPVVQLQTDGACHIEAMAIDNILNEFNLKDLDLLIVENIGNLVCPAEFNIGEDLRLAVLSIPEGDDKVEKYPLLFSRAHVLALTKADMLPHFKYDLAKVKAQTKEINPTVDIYQVNSLTGEGISDICNWLKQQIDLKKERS